MILFYVFLQNYKMHIKMKQFFSKPFVVFFTFFITLLLLFFLVKIEIFDGEVVYEKGPVHFKHQGPLSLSYFIGIGFNPEDLEGIKDFYLLPKGYFMAVLLILGFPSLAAYRSFLKKGKNEIGNNK